MKKRFLFILCFVLFIAAGILAAFPTEKASVKAEEFKNVSSNHSPEEMFQVFPDAKPSVSAYLPQNRKWNGCPNIAVTGKRIWACIYTGGIREPDPNDLNMGVVAVSDDGGNSWIDPYIVTKDPKWTTYQITPFYYEPLGRLYLFCCVSAGKIAYEYAVYTDNPEAPLNEVFWKFLNRNADGSVSYMDCSSGDWVSWQHQPLVINNDGQEEWIRMSRIYRDNAAASWKDHGIFVSTDYGKSWNLRSVITNPLSVRSAVTCPESVCVQLNDGRLMIYARIEGGKYGGVMRCYSSNLGKNWTDWEYELEEPLRGPGSLLDVKRLPSGNLLLVNNNTKSQRSGLTAYLSTDDGETYRYSLLIDERISSYPDIALDGNGNIYIINDAHRYPNGEIRMTVITEQDIINGYYSNPQKRNMLVCKVQGTDIKSTDLALAPADCTTGEDMETILRSLPTTVNCTLSDGSTLTLNGSWSSGGYSPTEKGVYTFRFESDDLPDGVYDVHGLLTHTVAVRGAQTPERAGLTWWAILLICSASVIFAGGITVAIIMIYKNKLHKGEEK